MYLSIYSGTSKVAKVLQNKFVTTLFLSLFSLRVSAAVLYVNQAAQGNQTGTSWQNAYPELYLAINQAQSGDEIWVAEGIYLPTSNTSDRYARFTLVDGVNLYGGFLGFENSVSARAGAYQLTILSGDLLGNDGTMASSKLDNSYRLLEASNTSLGITLDGFAIQSANQNNPQLNGGAFIAENADLTIRNCFFGANQAISEGAAIYAVQGTNLYIENSNFVRNLASQQGGAIQLKNASAELYKCIFNNNGTFTSNLSGGAIAADTVNTLAMDSCTFVQNIAPRGGCIYGKEVANLTIRNSVFSSNNGEYGGVAFLQETGLLKIAGTRFEFNTASEFGGVLMLQKGNVQEIISSEFNENFASESGGVFAFLGNFNLSLKNSKLHKNHCQNDIGLGYFYADPGFPSTLVAENCEFTENASDQAAIGCFDFALADIQFNNCLFEKNSAFGEAAICQAQQSTLRFNHTDIIDNSAEFATVFVTYNATQLSMRNCRIENNTSENLAPIGYSFWGSRLDIRNSTFKNNINLANDVAGIYANNCTDFLFHNNRVIGHDSGWYTLEISDIQDSISICNNLFKNNVLPVYISEYGQSCELINNTFIDNIRTAKSGLAAHAALHIKNTTAPNAAKVINSAFWQNENESIPFEASGTAIDVRYCLVQVPAYLQSLFNVSQNPAFIDTEGRIAGNSPLANAGITSMLPAILSHDLDNNTRVSGLSVDIGAYEAQVILTAEPPSEAYRFQVFPNPTSGYLFIEAKVAEPYDIRLFDQLGKVYHQQKNILGNASLTLNGLPAGIYFLQLKSEQQEIVKKIVKQ